MRRALHAYKHQWRFNCYQSTMAACGYREAAREKGVDDFLHHVKQQASPVIGRQIDCVLQHWHDLDAGKAAAEQSPHQLDDVDDDPHDAHSQLGTGMDEAETVHSWGTDA